MRLLGSQYTGQMTSAFSDTAYLEEKGMKHKHNDSAGGSGAEGGLKSLSTPIFVWSLIVQELTLCTIHRKSMIILMTDNVETGFLLLGSAVSLAVASQYHQVIFM